MIHTYKYASINNLGCHSVVCANYTRIIAQTSMCELVGTPNVVPNESTRLVGM